MSIHRKNRTGVIYPLTASVAAIYGIRGDGAYPIGAFYTVNIDSKIWEHIGGIWYRPYNSEDIENRRVSEEDLELFSAAVLSGDTITLRSGKRVDWEPIPEAEASQLPPVRPLHGG